MIRVFSFSFSCRTEKFALHEKQNQKVCTCRGRGLLHPLDVTNGNEINVAADKYILQYFLLETQVFIFYYKNNQLLLRIIYIYINMPIC